MAMRFGLRRHTAETDRGHALVVDQTGESDHVEHHQSALSNLFPGLPGSIPPTGLTKLSPQKNLPEGTGDERTVSRFASENPTLAERNLNPAHRD
jgi:hypothetical protein